MHTSAKFKGRAKRQRLTRSNHDGAQAAGGEGETLLTPPQSPLVIYVKFHFFVHISS